MPSNITLNVVPRGKPVKGLPLKLAVRLFDSTDSLHQQLANATGCSIHRLRISLGRDGSNVIADDSKTTLEAIGLANDMQIFVKDLGPQIGWRTVYIIEYLGPLFLHPLIYNLRLADPTPAQTRTFYMVMAHFIKRELESMFVHRFSSATMPLQNVFKNSFHYWILSGVLLAWLVYTPSAPAASTDPDPLAYLGVLCFIVGASMNTYVHLIQRSLRPAGTTKRQVPAGPGFSWVTCPNYMFETLAWVGVLLVSRSWAAALFVFLSVLQMKLWADKKEARYRREFPSEYVPKRFTLIPGLL